MTNAEKIQELLVNNEDFRTQFITNTKEICAKFGIEIEDEALAEISGQPDGGGRPKKCVIIKSGTGSDKGYLICDF